MLEITGVLMFTVPILAAVNNNKQHNLPEKTDLPNHPWCYKTSQFALLMHLKSSSTSYSIYYYRKKNKFLLACFRQVRKWISTCGWVVKYCGLQVKQDKTNKVQVNLTNPLQVPQCFQMQTQHSRFSSDTLSRPWEVLIPLTRLLQIWLSLSLHVCPALSIQTWLHTCKLLYIPIFVHITVFIMSTLCWWFRPINEYKCLFSPPPHLKSFNHLT